MSDEIVNLEIRQQNSRSVRSNGDWSTILSEPVQLNDGDSLSISKVFVDTISDSAGKILIENDISTDLTFYTYFTSISQINVANTAQGKTYIASPELGSFPASEPDGSDYILCSNQGHGAGLPPNMKVMTSFSIRSHEYDKLEHHMGDTTGRTPLYLGYYDQHGGQHTFFFEVAYQSVPLEGKTLVIATNILMDITKGFYINADMYQDFIMQHVSNKLDNFHIVSYENPSDNILVPQTVTRTIKIPAGSYGTDDMISLINNNLQSNVTGTQTSTQPEYFPSNELLEQKDRYATTAPIFVSTKTQSGVGTANGTGRVMIPDTTHSVNFWIGCNIASINYDLPSKKFYFENLHMPFYANGGNVSSTYQIDRNSTSAFFVGKNSGLFLHTWNTTNDDPSLSNYKENFNFWSGKLGFNEGQVTCKTINSTHMTLALADYTLPVFLNHGNGQSTTTQKAILDECINKTSDPYAVPADFTTIINLSDLTVPVVASSTTLNEFTLAYGYYLIEINNGLSSKLIGETDINHTISCIVNRYYSLGTFTSGDGTAELSYIHKGLPIFLKNFNVRILDSNKNLALNLDSDNSIFMSIIRNQNPQKPTKN